MKQDVCMYSGYKIPPGKGKRVVRADGKVMIFMSAKCEASVRMKKNPRKVCWTVLYRRKHKKGTQAEEITKRKSRKAVKFQRAVGGTSLADIIAKRNQKPEFRRAQREQAIKCGHLIWSMELGVLALKRRRIQAAKEATKATKAAKKVEKAKAPKSKAPMGKAPKPVKTAAPRVGAKR